MDLSKLSVKELRELRDNCTKWMDIKGIHNAMSFTIGQEVTVDHKEDRGQGGGGGGGGRGNSRP